MAEIVHSEMVRVLAKSGNSIAYQMSGSDAHLLHMAVGISGEAAELLDAYVISTEQDIDLDLVNVKEELGDLEFYIEGFRRGIRVTRDEVHEVHPNPFQNEYNQQAPWMCVHLSVASGELLDLVKKATVYRKEVPAEKLMELLAKIDHILGYIRELEGFGYQEILDGNIDKLGKRYKGFQYSDKAAQVRADKVS